MNIPEGTVLEQGDRGPLVRELQESLRKCGIYVGPTGADGDFGPATDAAVRYFQSTNNDLKIDGKVGKKTGDALCRCLTAREKLEKKLKDEKKEGELSGFFSDIIKVIQEYPWLDFIMEYGLCLKNRGHGGKEDLANLIAALKALKRPDPVSIIEILLAGGFTWADLIDCFRHAMQVIREQQEKKMKQAEDNMKKSKKTEQKKPKKKTRSEK